VEAHGAGLDVALADAGPEAESHGVRRPALQRETDVVGLGLGRAHDAARPGFAVVIARRHGQGRPRGPGSLTRHPGAGGVHRVLAVTITRFANDGRLGARIAV